MQRTSKPASTKYCAVVLVDLAREIADAHEALDAERLQRSDLAGAVGEDRNAILLLPVAQQVLLALVAEQEKRRRAGGMDDLDFGGGELFDALLVVRNDRPELALRAGRNIDVRDHDADAVGQNLDQVLDASGPQTSA